MAKPLIVESWGKQSSFNIFKLDRAKLYPTRKRIPLDGQQALCIKASLTSDGTQVLKSGMTAQGYFTESGRWVPKDELLGINPDGTTAELKSSTLGLPQAINGPVPPKDLLDMEVTSVYCLDVLEADPVLLEALNSGDVFSCDFNYGADYNLERAFLVANEEGIFALVGNPANPAWVDESEIFVPQGVEEVSDDDLDFEMM